MEPRDIIDLTRRDFLVNTDKGIMDLLQIERRGSGPDYPSYVLTARNAAFESPRSVGNDY